MNECHKYKLIFFHIPKNAGVSVRNALKIDRKSHNFPFTNVSVALPIDVKANTLESIYNDYHKFTIVRNPYERMVSLYNFRKQGNDLYDYVGMHESPIGPDGKIWDFNRWILSPEMKGTDEMGQKRMITDSYFHAYWYFKDHKRGYVGRNFIRTHLEFLNQIDFLTNPLIGGRLMPDTIIRQENLIDEWNEMFKKLGYKAPELGKSNTSKHTKKKTHYSHYYNDESYEFVTKLFSKDLSYFGYEFEDKR
tara:strand:- start:296 stop:1042 length:747 start_codon:yes stop_codon:yes gene_type:complete